MLSRVKSQLSNEWAKKFLSEISEEKQICENQLET